MMKIDLYFDGLCKPYNPGGHTTYGFVLKSNGETIAKDSGYLGEGKGMTNNVAEYTAMIEGLKYVKEKYPKAVVKVHGDSQLVIRQMTGRYAVRSDKMKPLWNEAKEIEKDIDKIKFDWIPREKNEEADKLTVLEYENKVYSERKEKAKEEDMNIEKIDKGLYEVKGKYKVDITDNTCTCPDHQNRGAKCKHIFNVEMELKEDASDDSR